MFLTPLFHRPNPVEDTQDEQAHGDWPHLPRALRITSITGRGFTITFPERVCTVCAVEPDRNCPIQQCPEHTSAGSSSLSSGRPTGGANSPSVSGGRASIPVFHSSTNTTGAQRNHG